ncbi:hypothetical protein B0T20DRAFT_486903 [Sordaria brevicollis]|uniref:Uncharacterized protein n=1 Tax=Sordaria brevicollis TaxID=83679 RepID=A0AAE0P8Z4_SORBR|nr:hypothetical protein B0T20DRAFT_486903 [Sordaria brevicollis]
MTAEDIKHAVRARDVPWVSGDSLGVPGKVEVGSQRLLDPRKRNEQDQDRGKEAPAGTVVGRVVNFDVATILRGQLVSERRDQGCWETRWSLIEDLGRQPQVKCNDDDDRGTVTAAQAKGKLSEEKCGSSRYLEGCRLASRAITLVERLGNGGRGVFVSRSGRWPPWSEVWCPDVPVFFGGSKCAMWDGRDGRPRWPAPLRHHILKHTRPHPCPSFHKEEQGREVQRTLQECAAETDTGVQQTASELQKKLVISAKKHHT